VIKSFQKVCLCKKAAPEKDRRFICCMIAGRRAFGDTLDGAVNLQFQMSGKIDGTAAASTKNRDDTVFAEQNFFFYAIPLLSGRVSFASHAYFITWMALNCNDFCKLCIFFTKMQGNFNGKHGLESFNQWHTLHHTGI